MLDVANLADTSSVRTLGPAAQVAARLVSEEYNERLTATLQVPESSYPDIVCSPR